MTNILNGEKVESFPLKSGMRQSSLWSSLPFNIVLPVLSGAIRQYSQNGEGVKLSLFSDNMVLDTRGPKYTLRKLLQRINNLSKMATYKNQLMKISRPTLNSLRKR